MYPPSSAKPLVALATSSSTTPSRSTRRTRDVKNKAGHFIEPCEQTAANATVGITSYPSDLRVDIVNQSSNPQAYPITGLTWALVYQNQTKAATAAALVNFFSWVLTKGQDLTGSVNYTPLGPTLQALCIAQLKKITVNGTPVSP